MALPHFDDKKPRRGDLNARYCAFLPMTSLGFIASHLCENAGLTETILANLSVIIIASKRRFDNFSQLKTNASVEAYQCVYLFRKLTSSKR